MNDSISDQEIIKMVINGDQASFRTLVDRYKGFVYTLTLRILRDDAEAEEAAQDAFIKCYQAIKTFSGKSKFSTWLYRIAFNTAISYKRKHRIEVSGLDENVHQIASGKSALEDLERDEKKRFINSALGRLSSADTAIITLFYMKELSLEEISEVTGMKKTAIKVKLFRARKRLAEELARQLATETESLL